MTQTLNSQGEIVIPAAVCREWGYAPGQTVQIEVLSPNEAEAAASFAKPTQEELMERFRGSLGKGNDAMGNMTTMEYLDWLRGPVELPGRASEQP